MTEAAHHILEATSSDGWDEWDRFVDAAPCGTVYHTSAWVRALSEGINQGVRVHLVEQSGAICAGAVLRRATKFGVAAGSKPWATAYNGLVVVGDARSAASGLLLDELLRAYHFVRLVQGPASSLAPDDFPRWRCTVDTTGLLDVCDLGLLWNSFDRRVRQRVRKATEAGVEITEPTDCDDIFELYRLTYARQGIGLPFPKSAFTGTIGTARASGIARVYVARLRAGDPAAALVVGADAKRAYFMLAASHPAHRKSDAMTLLWWDVIQRCAATHREIDLVGMGIPSIARFKQSFSPKIVPFLDARRYSSAWAKAVILAGQMTRRTVRRLRTKRAAKI